MLLASVSLGLGFMYTAEIINLKAQVARQNLPRHLEMWDMTDWIVGRAGLRISTVWSTERDKNAPFNKSSNSIEGLNICCLQWQCLLIIRWNGSRLRKISFCLEISKWRENGDPWDGFHDSKVLGSYWGCRICTMWDAQLECTGNSLPVGRDVQIETQGNNSNSDWIWFLHIAEYLILI